MTCNEQFRYGVRDGLKKYALASLGGPSPTEAPHQEYQPEGMGDRIAHFFMPHKMENMQAMSNAYDQNVKPYMSPTGHLDMGRIGQQAGSWLTNNIAKPLGQEVGNITSGNWGEAGNWVKQNPWLAGGAGLVGGLGVYGVSRILKNILGGNEPRPQFTRPQPYAIPGGGGPQAIEKGGSDSPLSFGSIGGSMLNTVGIPSELMDEDQQRRQVHQYNISSGNPRAKLLLANPQMRGYLKNLIMSVEQNQSAENM